MAPRHSRTASLKKSSVVINVYDLLAPGRLTNIAWALGCSMLHTGVVVRGVDSDQNDAKEYAFGGHDRPGLTGVYWTKPRTERPGTTFRCEILHGFTMATEEQLLQVINKASQEFLGTQYNLLTKNCNHFTSYLCELLTGQPAPAYLNRAASVGVAFPCIVPREWIEPPECDEGLDDEEAMLMEERYGRTYAVGDGESRISNETDEAGRELPRSERAPVKN